MSLAKGAARLRFVASTASTNADFLQSIAEGTPPMEGDWLIADRARQGRSWCDGTGNFMGSTVIRLALGDPAPATLSLAAGLALMEAVSPLVSPLHVPRLKWPNDLLIGDAKVAGILLERAGDWIVMGFGVNLATAPRLPDRATTALSRFGPAPDRDTFASSLAYQVGAEINRWRTYRLDPVLRRWTASAHPVGTVLKVSPPGEPVIAGRFAGLAADGSLHLRLDDATVRTVTAGDVALAERR